MDIKEELIKLREKIKGSFTSESTKAFAGHLKNSKMVVLDDKVDEFIDWFTENMVKGNYTDIGEYLIPIDMRNFIEKMAVWYELI